VSVARLEKRKQISLLIESFADVINSCDNFKDWKLDIVGYGSEEKKLKAQVHKLGVAEFVNYHAIIDDVYPFYHKASFFVLPSSIEGFPTGIRPGVNLSSINVAGDGVPQFNGISEKALNMVIPGISAANDVLITAANVMRKDAENITNWPIRVKNVGGISAGISNELKLYVDGFAGVLQHDISGSNLQIRMNNAGTTTTVMTVDSTSKVGINNPSPQYELDVTGTIQTNEQIRVTSLTDSSGVSSGSIITSGGAGIAKNLYVGGIADIDGPIVVGKPNLINPDTGSVNPVPAAILPDLNNLRTIGQPDKTFSAVYAT
jgi:hypothetical protein